MYAIPFLLFSIYILISSVFLRLLKLKKIDSFFILISFFIFFGFSGYIGTDWVNYIYSFENYNIGDFSYSPVFDLLQLLFKKLGFSFLNFKVFLFLIISFLMYFLLKLFKINLSFFVVFLIAYAPLLLTDTYRNTVGLLVYYCFFFYFGKEKNIRFWMVLFVLPLLLHISLYVVLLCLFFSNKFYSRKTYIVAFLVVVFVGFTDVISNIFYMLNGIGFTSEIFLRYASYSNSTQEYGFTLGVVEKFLFFSLFVMGLNRFKSQEFSPVVFNLSIVYCFLYVGFFNHAFVIQRVSLLFIIPFLITVLYGLSFFKKYTEILLVIFLLIICLYKINIGFNRPLYEYKNTIFSHESFEKRKLIRDIHYMDRD